MPRLRSAARQAADDVQSTASSLPRSTTSASLIQTPARKTRSRMPIPATPSAPISYPSLEGLCSEKKPTQSGPKTPSSGISVPALPPKTSRKPPPSASMPGSFGTPGNAADFAFKMSPDLEDYGRKVLDEVRDRARDYRAKMEADPITPPSNLARSPSKQAVTTVRRKTRFSDAHREQFSKMESIADHYAVKRTKVVTPQNPQKGIKRSQSQATLDEKSLPPTPSPVKEQPDQTLAMQQEEDRSAKRMKVSSFSAKIGSIVATPKKTSQPLTSAAKTAAARRVNRPLPALPRTAGIEPTVKLAPTGGMPRSPSKIPVTPSSRRLLNLAPATIATAPKFSLPTDTPKAASLTAGVDTPQQSEKPKPKAIKELKQSGEMTLPRTHAGVLSPVKITEAVDLEDPFASSKPPQKPTQKHQGWGFVAPAGNPAMPDFPKVPTHEPGSQLAKPQASARSVPAVNNGSKKRKDMASAPEETGGDGAPRASGDATPARKKTRFDPAAAAVQGAKNVMEKGRALFDKARIDFLATPKRRVEKARATKNAAKKKPTWK